MDPGLVVAAETIEYGWLLSTLAQSSAGFLAIGAGLAGSFTLTYASNKSGWQRDHRRAAMETKRARHEWEQACADAKQLDVHVLFGACLDWTIAAALSADVDPAPVAVDGRSIVRTPTHDVAEESWIFAMRLVVDMDAQLQDGRTADGRPSMPKLDAPGSVDPIFGDQLTTRLYLGRGRLAKDRATFADWQQALANPPTELPIARDATTQVSVTWRAYRHARQAEDDAVPPLRDGVSSRMRNMIVVSLVGVATFGVVIPLCFLAQQPSVVTPRWAYSLVAGTVVSTMALAVGLGAVTRRIWSEVGLQSAKPATSYAEDNG